MTSTESQPMLFADLPIPPAPPEAPPKPSPRRRGVVAAVRRWLQLALDFDFREGGASRQADAFLDDEDTAYDFPQHRRAVAGREPPPKTHAPASIWAFARDLKAAPGKRAAAGTPSGLAPAPAPLYRVEREAGRVRVVRLRPEETEERIEQERARRAKQRPPKPTKKARTKSKKLIELIGTHDDD